MTETIRALQTEPRAKSSLPRYLGRTAVSQATYCCCVGISLAAWLVSHIGMARLWCVCWGSTAVRELTMAASPIVSREDLIPAPDGNNVTGVRMPTAAWPSPPSLPRRATTPCGRFPRRRMANDVYYVLTCSRFDACAIIRVSRTRRSAASRQPCRRAGPAGETGQALH